MIRTNILALALFATLLFGSAAQAQTMTPKPATTMKMAGVAFLTGAGGMTLYTLDADPPGASPPLMASPGAKPMGDYTVVTRGDGSRQWAYKGKPLYYFAKDQQPMDVYGQGVAGKWEIALP
jgi:predicted lipoprotein with Yx(FWY)xxD motif